MRRLVAACVVFGALTIVTEGVAQDGSRTVAVVVEGAEADAIAAGVSGHVMAPHATRDPAALRAALASRGTKGLAPAVGHRAKDAQLVTRARAAMTDAHVDVAILVVRRKDKKGVHVWAIDAKGSGAAVDKDIAGASAAELADAVWSACESLLPAASPVASKPEPAAPPTPAPAEQTPPPSAPADTKDTTAQPAPAADEGRARARALLVVHAEIAGGSRHFSYVDRITPALRPYDLFAAPLPSIDVELYPLARTSIAVVRGLGITGGYARAIGVASADAGGTKVDTSWQRFDVGLRARFDVARNVIVGVAGGYGGIDFKFGDFPGGAAILPSVAYRFVHAGPDVRVMIGKVSFYGGGAYLPVLSTGAIGDLFPRASKGGVEANVGGAYLVAPSVEVSLALGYTRFFYSLRPEVGDANVAGGALDQMAKLGLGVAYLMQ